jgi:hypothetical protein
MSASLAAVQLAVLLGASHESIPPNGTWWQADQPHSFSTIDGPSYGLALVGSQWSLTAERMGKATSHALACANNEPACRTGGLPYAHWEGSEQPWGMWAAWEPQLGHAFAQLGAGAVEPAFRMHIPDWNGNGPAVPVTVGNTRIVVSPLAGIGYRAASHLDVMLNWRMVRAANEIEGARQTQYQGLGWGVFNAGMRWRF